MVYKVLVLPEPVGPTIIIKPDEFFKIRENLSLSFSVMPIPVRVKEFLSLVKIRITIFSP